VSIACQGNGSAEIILFWPAPCCIAIDDLHFSPSKDDGSKARLLSKEVPVPIFFFLQKFKLTYIEFLKEKQPCDV
jgi:hypothetical protein